MKLLRKILGLVYTEEAQIVRLKSHLTKLVAAIEITTGELIKVQEFRRLAEYESARYLALFSEASKRENAQDMELYTEKRITQEDLQAAYAVSAAKLENDLVRLHSLKSNTLKAIDSLHRSINLQKAKEIEKQAENRIEELTKRHETLMDTTEITVLTGLEEVNENPINQTERS